jgi:hypothetical protein
MDSSLTGGNAFAFSLYFAFGKINCLSAPAAGVRAIEFIGKNFFFLAAIVTLANQCFKILKVIITRAMLGC